MPLTQSPRTRKISDIYLKYLLAVSVLFCPVSPASYNEDEFTQEKIVPKTICC